MHKFDEIMFFLLVFMSSMFQELNVFKERP